MKRKKKSLHHEKKRTSVMYVFLFSWCRPFLFSWCWADFLFFFFGGKHKLKTFLRFLSTRKQKFRKTFQCCQQKKQSNCRCWCCFFVCANLYCSEKSFHQQRKTKRNWLFPLLILFACFFFCFCCFEEKKKVISQKTEKKKTLHPKNVHDNNGEKAEKNEEKRRISPKKTIRSQYHWSWQMWNLQ